MARFLPLLLFCSVSARAATAPDDPPPSFWSLETPWQMLGQAGAGAAGAMVGGAIGAGFGSSRANRACRERIDPEFSDECGWSALGGAVFGFLIGAPVGHALGALAAGLIQEKRGAPVAALSALAGDAALLLLAFGVHDALDGKLLPNGELDPILIPVTVTGMVAIPVVTQSVWDYRVRIALQPGVARGAGAGDTRYLLRIAEVRF